MIVNRWLVVEPKRRPTNCLIALTGRSIPADMMVDLCSHLQLERTLLVCLEPHQLEWYPMPNGPEDQEDAINGLHKSVDDILIKLRQISRLGGRKPFKLSNMAFLGYSAGAALAMQTLLRLQKRMLGVISLAGCILDTEDVPEAKTDTPIFLKHNMDDLCFDWFERYLPTKNVLQKKGYNIIPCEFEDGGHGLCWQDIHAVRGFIEDYCFLQ